MGRAQALQALACGLDPDVAMNPVLLKPMGNGLSQIIVLGKALGAMTYTEYVQKKASIWREARKAYRELASQVDVMIIEGAGSPAEINLQQHDIVNMRMAREARAAVLLVADIDRGGAFASLAGTMALIRASDRKYVRGFILNKFRGDKSLLLPAMSMLEKKCKRPFLGIVPMLEDLRLPEEDSASFDLMSGSGIVRHPGASISSLDVGVLKFPSLSNFTDMDPLAREKLLKIRYIKNEEEFGNPDLLVLPGSRKVGDCLNWLKRTGLEQKVKNYVVQIKKRQKGMLAGICAGMQLMGRKIEDPYGVEGERTIQGLDMLPLVTVLAQEKVQQRTCATALPPLVPAATPLEGYEIHHGKSHAIDFLPVVLRDKNGEALGYGLPPRDEGPCRIWGTYLHGLFDNDKFRHELIKALARGRDLQMHGMSEYRLDGEIDRLADEVEANMDMKAIYALLGM